jgi:hypothetical protein
MQHAIPRSELTPSLRRSTSRASRAEARMCQASHGPTSKTLTPNIAKSGGCLTFATRRVIRSGLSGAMSEVCQNSDLVRPVRNVRSTLDS